MRGIVAFPRAQMPIGPAVSKSALHARRICSSSGGNSSKDGISPPDRDTIGMTVRRLRPPPADKATVAVGIPGREVRRTAETTDRRSSFCSASTKISTPKPPAVSKSISDVRSRMREPVERTRRPPGRRKSVANVRSRNRERAATTTATGVGGVGTAGATARSPPRGHRRWAAIRRWPKVRGPREAAGPEEPSTGTADAAVRVLRSIGATRREVAEGEEPPMGLTDAVVRVLRSIVAKRRAGRGLQFHRLGTGGASTASAASAATGLNAEALGRRRRS
ncbi:uncharacterized protein LOC142907509 [Petromyzon marinus]|uniref:uncharacterized protein LOC142907509 n=1 Tax=Petromyzon marinus TaxID=7757 RepID=UPI003F72BC7D